MDICSLWNYQESIEELKHKLLYRTLELQNMQMEANEEMRKNEEYVKHLLNLLKIAYQERDEAKHNLQKILYKFLPSSPPDIFTHKMELEIPLVKVKQAKSSITESNSFSDTYNNMSHNSSPVDSFFDPTASSPELSVPMNVSDSSNIGFVNNKSLVNDFDQISGSDRATVLINNLVKGKTLPKIGELHNTVATPTLLQTLLLTGELPKWRNQPPVHHFNIPPVSIGGCHVPVMNQKQIDMSRGSSSVTISAPMLSFGGGAADSCLNSRRLSSVTVTGKRQRE